MPSEKVAGLQPELAAGPHQRLVPAHPTPKGGSLWDFEIESHTHGTPSLA